MSGTIELPDVRAALAAAAPGADPSVWVPALTEALTACQATTPHRMAAFLGQCSVEAGPAFKEVAENLYYTHPQRILDVWPPRFNGLADAIKYVGVPEKLANRVYSNRMGNGDEASGDGWRFRGGGLLQLTGRDEYTGWAKARGLTIDIAAALIRTPKGAADAAGWYWQSRGLNELADGWMLTLITERINGRAKLGLADRIAASNAALAAIGDAVVPAVAVAEVAPAVPVLAEVGQASGGGMA